ncbi:hypothetical protein ppKF707_4319 [Metapseudomonas furukawaii]|uniref:Uncharacterized protein n=1 Tax=Metapseudomonas furukawaii TaxID=1149133 RepID=A0AAD1C0E8_METFU|nr:hypothetical protein ppKF707_4319 [Pseudomonas furukawaii]BAU75016.1 hypothetical protein KF707C_33280 [Pseudomonas furukawaii]
MPVVPVRGPPVSRQARFTLSLRTRGSMTDPLSPIDRCAQTNGRLMASCLRR